MSGIVQVLDQNHEWGSKLLNLTLKLLLFCAAPKPQKRTQTPQFSLVRIPVDMRQSWLMALLIILYKVLRNNKLCFLPGDRYRERTYCSMGLYANTGVTSYFWDDNLRLLRKISQNIHPIKQLFCRRERSCRRCSIVFFF